ncbi:MAG: toll/interleukin-1 receptor domain-containing protein [Desulfobacteraceae bacterium]|nr:toll/interleukin-1 receptor domain-containing protein [Desulfobacteraceae bacterium]
MRELVTSTGGGTERSTGCDGRYAPFRVTLLGFTSVEASDIEGALRQAGESFRYEVRREGSASGAFFPAEVIHAIVFTSQGVVQVTAEDVNAIRSATKPGTCRVYLADTPGAAPPAGTSRLDDFIQRTSANGCAAVAEQIIAFFQEADNLNRHNTPLAFRDMTCLFAYKILKYLWPVSYVFAALHIVNAATALAGRGPLLGTPASHYVVPASTFFGTFMIAHCIFVVGRNWLFGARIVKHLGFAFAWGAAGFGLTAAATAYSIAVTDQDFSRISVSAVLAIAVYRFYMYARRIRGECTSLSQLQAAMADTQRRNDVLSSIGGQRFVHSAFPLFSFRRRTLFISYMRGSPWSSETAVLAHQWASKHGFEVFLDQSTIPSGALWRQSLLRAISECGFFVAVIDGDAAITEWVLAESAYAALLRKSIGKPRILLLIRNVKRIAKDQANPMHLIYLDVFQLPPSRCFGAGILPIEDDHQLMEERFLQAFQAVRPMCLLS